MRTTSAAARLTTTPVVCRLSRRTSAKLRQPATSTQAGRMTACRGRRSSGARFVGSCSTCWWLAAAFLAVGPGWSAYQRSAGLSTTGRTGSSLVAAECFTWQAADQFIALAVAEASHGLRRGASYRIVALLCKPRQVRIASCSGSTALLRLCVRKIEVEPRGISTRDRRQRK